MGEEDTRAIVVVTDTSIVINFLNIGRLDLLTRHHRYRFIVTEHVEEEVEYPEQEEELLRALNAKELGLVEVTSNDALAIFAELEQYVGRGEASCIALAQEKGWLVATDERGRTLREIEKRLGRDRLLTTVMIIKGLIVDGGLSIAEADEIKRRLAEKKFSMPFQSFSEIL